MMADRVTDVVVIGGGPGGAMASTVLADAGKSVIALEAAKFPRYHIGESLLSGTADLLKRIGVLEQLEAAGYIKKWGVEWVWGEQREPWTVYFKDALAMPYDYGYQVERDQFDQMLLENARAHGVDVRENCRATDFGTEANDLAWVEYKDSNGETQRIYARWVIDASGQGGFVTKRLNRQQWDPHLKNMAVWSYWKGARRGDGIDAGNTFLPTFGDGWWWFIPLRNDVTSIGAVVDREALPNLQAKGLQEYYLECIRKTPEIASRLATAEQVGPVRAQRDWSYAYDQFYGNRYIAVGDAACFIDPLFSTGVHLAMLSGLLAAVTVNTLLDKPDLGHEAMLQFYERTYKQEFARLKAQVYFLYGGHASSKESYFWHARKQFGVPGIAPEKAFISLIAGAFRHRSWYSRFLKQLDVPPDLKGNIEGIFEGKLAGVGVNLDRTLVAIQDVTIIDDYAVDGSHLKKSRSVCGTDGSVLALTPALDRIIKLADGTRTGREIIASVMDGGAVGLDHAQSVLNEAISIGLITIAQVTADSKR